MFETNKDLDRQVSLRQSEEDALLGLLDKSTSVTKKVFKKKVTEEQLVAEAIRQSELEQKQLKRKQLTEEE